MSFQGLSDKPRRSPRHLLAQQQLEVYQMTNAGSYKSFLLGSSCPSPVKSAGPPQAEVEEKAGGSHCFRVTQATHGSHGAVASAHITPRSQAFHPPKPPRCPRP